MERAQTEGVRFVLDGRTAEVPETGFYLASRALRWMWTPTACSRRKRYFGPVLCVHTFDNVDEAIAIANGTQYGLGASIWSNNLENVMYISKRCAGNINVNGGTGPVVELPFGGFKQSGFGRDRSLHAIDKYSDLKNVIIRTAR